MWNNVAKKDSWRIELAYINLPMKLYCDDKVDINIARNLVQHNWTKHIEIGRHFMKQRIGEGIICVIGPTTAASKHPHQGVIST